MALTIFAFNSTSQQYAIREAGGVKYNLFKKFIESSDEFYQCYGAFQVNKSVSLSVFKGRCFYIRYWCGKKPSRLVNCVCIASINITPQIEILWPLLFTFFLSTLLNLHLFYFHHLTFVFSVSVSVIGSFYLGLISAVHMLQVVLWSLDSLNYFLVFFRCLENVFFFFAHVLITWECFFLFSQKT